VRSHRTIRRGTGEESLTAWARSGAFAPKHRKRLPLARIRFLAQYAEGLFVDDRIGRGLSKRVTASGDTVTPRMERSSTLS
jgi:hypothetical protein